MQQDDRTSKVREASYSRRASDRRRPWRAQLEAVERRAAERRGARGAVSWRSLVLALSVAAVATLLLATSCAGGH